MTLNQVLKPVEGDLIAARVLVDLEGPVGLQRIEAGHDLEAYAASHGHARVDGLDTVAASKVPPILRGSHLVSLHDVRSFVTPQVVGVTGDSTERGRDYHHATLLL